MLRVFGQAGLPWVPKRIRRSVDQVDSLGSHLIATGIIPAGRAWE